MQHRRISGKREAICAAHHKIHDAIQSSEARLFPTNYTRFEDSSNRDDDLSHLRTVLHYLIPLESQAPTVLLKRGAVRALEGIVVVDQDARERVGRESYQIVEPSSGTSDSLL